MTLDEIRDKRIEVSHKISECKKDFTMNYHSDIYDSYNPYLKGWIAEYNTISPKLYELDQILLNVTINDESLPARLLEAEASLKEIEELLTLLEDFDTILSLVGQPARLESPGVSVVITDCCEWDGK